MTRETTPSRIMPGSPWPNPVSSVVAIPCRSSTDMELFAAVHAPSGRMLDVLCYGRVSGGDHTPQWRVARHPGTYLCRVTAGGSSASTPVAVLH